MAHSPVVGLDNATKAYNKFEQRGNFSFLLEEFPTADVASVGFRLLDAKARLKLLQERAWEFYSCTTDQNSCFLEMEELLLQHIECGKGAPTPRNEVSRAETDAISTISRLPRSSVELPDFVTINDEIKKQGLPLGPPLNLDLGSWDTLEVNTAVSQVVMRAALIALPREPETLYFRDDTDKLANFISELLEVVSSMAVELESSSEKCRWLLVRCFLWTCWQRLILLKLDRILVVHLRRGWYEFDAGRNQLFRATQPSPTYTLDDVSRHAARQAKSDYMCNWALELHRSQDVCMSPDFRAFHNAFTTAFTHLGARCNSTSTSKTKCDGSRPNACQRFANMTGVEDQSAHDYGCNGQCSRMIWNRRSFERLTDARAVKITSEGTLSYCEVDSNTLAISHVWIAGMGGCPERGLNACLHHRFSQLARHFDCASYWIDAACVPEEPKLRQEAIRGMNRVYKDSGVTLACDRDLMSVNVAACKLKEGDLLNEHTVAICEQLLATLLVCDWSVRAWTFLESIMGRQKLLLLCKNNEPVSFADVVRVVHQRGNISLAVMTLSILHLFPSRGSDSRKKVEYQKFKLGDSHIPIGHAGTFLSYRPARRERDELLIWSLLVRDEEPYTDPVEFWLSRRGTSLNMGFLMSSCPRLDHEGLTWAPATPNAGRGASSGFYRAYEGEDTGIANITKHGLQGFWTCFIFPIRHGPKKPHRSLLASLKALGSGQPSDRDVFESDYPSDFLAQCDEIESKYLKHFRWGLLMQPNYSDSYHLRPTDIRQAFKEPMESHLLTGGSFAAPYRGPIKGSLFAVCGTNDDFEAGDPQSDGRLHMGFYTANMRWPAWKWRGVFEWPPDVVVPCFREHAVWIA